MASTRSSSVPAQSRVARWLPAFAGLLALLVLVQALLAGEWLAGNDVIKVHETIGSLILLLALIYAGLVIFYARGAARIAAVSMAVLFAVLVAVQLGLGYGGFDHANQARALHVTNGVLLFGLAVGNVTVARRSIAAR
jgi:hypothetical protein